MLCVARCLPSFSASLLSFGDLLAGASENTGTPWRSPWSVDRYKRQCCSYERRLIRDLLALVYATCPMMETPREFFYLFWKLRARSRGNVKSLKGSALAPSVLFNSEKTWNRHSWDSGLCIVCTYYVRYTLNWCIIRHVVFVVVVVRLTVKFVRRSLSFFVNVISSFASR